MKRQRDRFRKEALRREREASIAKGNSEQLTRDNQELRKENMHLYKKIMWVPPSLKLYSMLKTGWNRVVAARLRSFFFVLFFES